MGCTRLGDTKLRMALEEVQAILRPAEGAIVTLLGKEVGAAAETRFWANDVGHCVFPQLTSHLFIHLFCSVGWLEMFANEDKLQTQKK